MSIPRSFFFIKRTEQSKGHKENRRTEDASCNSSVQLQKLKLELQLELVLALQTPCGGSLWHWRLAQLPYAPRIMKYLWACLSPSLCPSLEWKLLIVYCIYRSVCASNPSSWFIAMRHCGELFKKHQQCFCHLYTIYNNHNHRLKYVGNLVVIASVFKADSKLNHVTVSSAIHTHSVRIRIRISTRIRIQIWIWILHTMPTCCGK